MNTEVVLVNPRKYRRNPGLPNIKSIASQFDWKQMVGGMSGGVFASAAPKLLSRVIGKRWTSGWFGLGISLGSSLLGGYYAKKLVNPTFGSGFLVGGLAITGLKLLRRVFGKRVAQYTNVDGLGDEFLYGDGEDMELFGDDYNYGAWSPEEAGDRSIVGLADEAFEGAFGELDALDDDLIPTFTGL